jgi:winged helix-turn-helix DNA-binding protein
MADFLDQKRGEIAARLKELTPLVDEYTRLQAAIAALEDVPGTPARQRSPTPGPKASPRRRGEHDSRPPGRPKGSGNRATDALQIVKANPGITVPEIAQKLGIKQNYLYRVLPRLANDGLVTKQGRGWHPQDPA